MTLHEIATTARRAAAPHDRRARLLVSYGLLLAILFASLTFVRALTSDMSGYWTGLLDKLSAAVVLAFIALLWYRLLAPRRSFSEELEIVDAWNIGPKLAEPLLDTKFYWFRGRSARWFRTQAVPALLNSASKDQTTRRVHLLLPDPDDAGVLQTYADHRNSLAGGDDGHWTAARIRHEILATILVVAHAAIRNRLFKAEVTVLPEFSIFRYDLSDAGLMMTREDKRLPGWLSPAGTRFYASVQEDLRLAAERGRQVQLNLTWPSSITQTDIPTLVGALGFVSTLTDDEAEAVLEAFGSTDSPYV